MSKYSNHLQERWWILPALCFSLLMVSCGPEVPVGNRAMAERLAALERRAVESKSYPYFNRMRADFIAEKLKGIPYSVPVQWRLEYIEQLLWAGENERCIVEAESVVQNAFSGQEVNSSNLPYYRLLALAYLRLGEQENCLTNRDARSCIIPIAEGGVHRLRSGSEQAVDVYLRILKAYPDDLQSRWLLNIAYMTLGRHPQAVPDSLLIPSSVFESEYELPFFPDVAPAAGVDVLGHAGSCSMDDFDGDGRLDIFTTSYIIGEPAQLFINDGDGTFSDRSEAAGLTGLTGGLNEVHADFDNDGLLDIFITRGAWLGTNGRFPNSLLRNLGGTFEDVTEEAGMLSLQPSQTAAWADFNLDGRLDLFVGSESSGNAGFPCELYVNQGDGTFRNVAEELGLDITALVKGASWGDVNNDGWPDLYVSILGEPNKLFINREGKESTDRRFEEAAVKAGVEAPVYSFPGWFFDYDNDGWDDLFVSGYHRGNSDQMGAVVAADYLGQPFDVGRPRLYRNRGDETFQDVTDSMGLNHALFTMGSNYGDLDNDGWLDFYLGTGDFSLWATVPNRMFRNAEGRRFQDVTTAGGFGQIQKGHGVSFGDFDGDGDQDIYTVIGGAVEGDVYPNMLFLNPGNDNNWVTLQLEGSRSNRSAIGARVRLVATTPDGRRREIHRTVRTGGSFGANSLQLEIGLGNAGRIDTLEVRWPGPDRSVERWADLQTGRRYRVVEGQEAVRPYDLSLE